MGRAGQGGDRIGARRQAPRGRRALVIGALLSLVVPGLGHLYLGRRARAAIWFVGYMVVTAIFWARDELGSPGALVLVSAMSLIAAADAVIIARLGPG